MCACTMLRIFLSIYFQLRQLIAFPVWGQLCCYCQGEESTTNSIKGCLLSKVVFNQRLSSIKGRLPFVFCQMSSSIISRLPSKVVFHQSLSSVKGHLSSKVVFHQKSSSVKGRLLLKVVFRQRSSSSFGSFSFLGFSPECGIAKLSLSLFVSSCWST